MSKKADKKTKAKKVAPPVVDHRPSNATIAAAIASDPELAAVVTTSPKASKPMKVKREPLEERNGVTRPRSPGKCADVWSAMDAIQAKGTVPTSADAKAWAEGTGANVSNATQELARWRKFNGVERVREG